MKVIFFINKFISPIIFRYYGIDIFRYHKWLLETEKWSIKKREEYRLKRLGDIIEHCWDNVPFYRELWHDHGVKIRRPKEMCELEAFPIVDRYLFKENRERIISENLKKIPHKDDSTGGTTGVPLRYKQDLELHALRYGFELIGFSFTGYRYGDNICIIAGGSLLPKQSSLKNKIRNWLERKKGIYCVGMSEEIAEDCYRTIEKHKPFLLYGYPSMISEFCNFIKNKKLNFSSLKAVITTAEMLYTHYRKNIEETLNVPVFNSYGFNDGGLLSYECELHRGFHYNDLESIIEIKPHGEVGIGPLVVTNIWNRSMPFIRYENGDIIELGEKKCLCGRPYPLILNVKGRTGDVLRFENGRSLGVPGLSLIFKNMSIDGWQVVQTGGYSLDVRIKAKDILTPDEVNYIKKVLNHYLSKDIKINICYVKELATTRGGKLKPVFIEYEKYKNIY